MKLESNFEQLWINNKSFLRRFIISLTHDIDMADDLLQETYIKAKQGIAGYKGGDFKAWLTAIAKNQFYSQIRKPVFNREILSSSTLFDSADNQTGDTVVSLEIHRALSGLSQTLRTTLMLKYYQGFTYEEIACELKCPIGTVKRRVNLAIGKLRQTLGHIVEDAQKLRCTQITGSLVLDYISNRLSQIDMMNVKAHLNGCSFCQDIIDSTKGTLMTVNDIDYNYRLNRIIEVDTHDIRAVYVLASYTNNTETPISTHIHKCGIYNILDYVIVDGKEADFDPPVHIRGTCHGYTVHLPEPLQPGKHVDILSVGHTLPDLCTVPDEHGIWTLGPGGIRADQNLLSTIAVRLPESAILEDVIPKTFTIRKSYGITLTWKNHLLKGEDFEFLVKYRLQS